MKTTVKNQFKQTFTFKHHAQVQILKVGFDAQGKPCYSESKEKGIFTFRGSFLDSKHFETLTPKS